MPPNKKGIIKTKNNKTTKLDWLIENWLALDDLKDEVDMDNDVVQKALIRMAVRTGVNALRRREASSCKWMQELDREKQGPSYVALAQAIWAQQPASEELASLGNMDVDNRMPTIK